MGWTVYYAGVVLAGLHQCAWGSVPSMMKRRALLRGVGASVVVGTPTAAIPHDAEVEDHQQGYLRVEGWKEAPSTGVTGLVRLPPATPLRNTYVLVRACECETEAASGRIWTNAAFKMSIEAGSLTERGLEDARTAGQRARELLGEKTSPLIFYDTGRASTQTAEALASVLDTSRDRLVPEFQLLEARGWGKHEGERSILLDELRTMYDARSRFLTPVEGEDGAYAESVEDALVRFRQVLSKIETMYCGESVVLVAPGADLFSIANAAVRGDDLRKHFVSSGFDAPGAVVPLGHRPSVPVRDSSKDPGRDWAEAERAGLSEKRADLDRAASQLRDATQDARRLSRLAIAKAYPDRDARELERTVYWGGLDGKNNLGLSGLVSLAAVAALVRSRLEHQRDPLEIPLDDPTTTRRLRVSPVPVGPTAPARAPLAPPPDLSVPCPPGDDLCVANYLNEDDDAWLRNIADIRAEHQPNSTPDF